MELTKKQRVIALVNDGNFHKAFSIAKNFVREFSKDERRSIQIAYESNVGRAFYESLGIDVDAHILKANSLLLNYSNNG